MSPASWTDTSGNFWLFGGYGSTTSNAQGDLNDLWKFSNGQWTWVGGSSSIQQAGIYGTQGVPSSTNIPGGRYEATSCTDPSGNFWMYGGLGEDGAGTRGDLSDLWKYADGQWTWVSGPSTIVPDTFPPGVYGTKGVPASTNHPSARVDAVSWCDASGNFWLFGGSGTDSAGNGGILNDLWKFSNGQWTWVSGSNLANQYGIYGTQGTPSLTNAPGARALPVAWLDKAGAFWLFGGSGNDLNGQNCLLKEAPVCLLNDLWKFSNGQWTWVGGSNISNQYGIYGTQGTPSTTNIPGARWFSSALLDSSGVLWLFGGLGFDSTHGNYEVFGDLNDLWTYSNGQWTWIAGSTKAGDLGSYGTLGKAASTNDIPARDSQASWIDASGNFWVFGGSNAFDVGGSSKFNDMWEYQP